MSKLTYKIIILGLLVFSINQYIIISGYEQELFKLTLAMDNVMDICF